MYAHVLVPLDGSERAERAVPVAERIARNAGADRRITLLQVVSRPAPLSGAYVPQSPSVEWIQQDVAAAKTYLAHVAGWSLLNGLSVETRVEIGGAPAPVIAGVAEADGTDLIVLCSHGRTGATHWLLGSVAEQVARHASMPVLVLRERGAGHGTGTMTDGSQTDPNQHFPLRALVPLDGSSFAEAALRPVATLLLALAAPNQATIHLVLVLSPVEADPATIPEHPALQSMRIYLMRVADRLRAIYPRLDVGWSIEPGVDAARVLLRLAGPDASARPDGAPGGFELIALATHGRSGVSRWVLGSVTEQVLHHTHLPLLVVRPRTANAKEVARRADQPYGPTWTARCATGSKPARCGASASTCCAACPASVPISPPPLSPCWLTCPSWAPSTARPSPRWWASPPSTATRGPYGARAPCGVGALVCAARSPWRPWWPRATIR